MTDKKMKTVGKIRSSNKPIGQYRVDQDVRMPDQKANGLKPGHGRGFIRKLPLANMRIGASFVIPNEDAQPSNRIWSLLDYPARKAGVKLRFACLDNGSVRVWRVA
jgi:hypothetical protein